MSVRTARPTKNNSILAFALHSVLTCRGLSDLGEFDNRFCPDRRYRHRPSPWTKGFGTSNNPVIRFTPGPLTGYRKSQKVKSVKWGIFA